MLRPSPVRRPRTAPGRRRADRPLLALLVCTIVMMGGSASASTASDAIEFTFEWLSAAGLVDQAVVEARPMIECLADGGDPDVCAQKVASEKAKSLLPTDSRVKLVVDVIHAVRESDWLRLLELAGSDMARAVACGILPGGGVKNAICGEAFDIALGIGKATLESAIANVKQKDWPGLILDLGVQPVCSLVPADVWPAKEALCGVIGLLVDKAEKLIEKGIEAVVEGIKAVGGFVIEVWKDEDDPMTPAAYFETRLVPRYHCRTWLLLLPEEARQGLNHNIWCEDLCENVRSSCESYFDSHKMSASDAKRVCNPIVDRYVKDTDAIKAALETAEEPYYTSRVAPSLLYWAFHTEKKWNLTATLNSVEGAARQELARSYWAPQGELVESIPSPSVHGYVAGRIRNRLKEALSAHKDALHAELKSLETQGCRMSSFPANSPLTCSTYESYRACRQSFISPYPDKPGCALDQQAADRTLALQVQAELGKRCRLGPAGTDVICTRPWKHEACSSRVSMASHLNGVPSGVTCTSDLARFTAERQLASELLDILNGKVTWPDEHVKGAGVKKITPYLNRDRCRETWDPLAIQCENEKQLPSLASDRSNRAFESCPEDPGKDGVDHPCFRPWSGAITLKASSRIFGPLVSHVPPAIRKPRTDAPPVTPDARHMRPTRPGSEPRRPGRAPESRWSPPATPQRKTDPAGDERSSERANLPGSGGAMVTGRKVGWGKTVRIDPVQAHAARRSQAGACEAEVTKKTSTVPGPQERSPSVPSEGPGETCGSSGLNHQLEIPGASKVSFDHGRAGAGCTGLNPQPEVRSRISEIKKQKKSTRMQ